MSKLFAVVALVFALAPGSGRAQFGGPGVPGGPASPPGLPAQAREYRVKVETTKGGGLTGSLALATVEIDGDAGVYMIQADKVKEVRFAKREKDDRPVVDSRGAHVKGRVVVISGDEIDGTIFVPGWVLKTDLGSVTLAPEKLQSVTFLPKQEAGDAGKGDGKRDTPAEKK